MTRRSVCLRAPRLRTPGTGTERTTHQIHAEIELLCRVRHPHINGLLAVSFNGPHRCLVLELMNGGALDDRLMSTDLPVLQWQDRARILLHVARGLVYMHSLKPAVVHRDVKTGNVLLHFDEQNDLSMAKVSDFGTVRVNKETQALTMATSVKTHASTKQVCGTGPYMPPGTRRGGRACLCLYASEEETAADSHSNSQPV